MASFPLLKTGAIAQYGASRTRIFSTRVVRFLDGSEQRIPQYTSALHAWTIRLDLLDESELTQLEQFFAGEVGRGGQFSFTDPWDGTVYANCSFGEDELATEFRGLARGRVSLTVKENRT
jgi:hypothetical protein